MNNEIETLYPVKKKNNKVPFLILIVIIIGLVVGFSLKTNIFKEKKQNQPAKTEEKNTTDNTEENKNEENKEGQTIEIIKNNSYKCTKPQLKRDDYTLDYEYYFLFENNTLISGYTNYIYKFNTLEAFNAFKLPTPPNTELKEEKNDPTNLVRVINLNSYYPQEETGDNAINAYIKMLENRDYTCEISK